MSLAAPGAVLVAVALLAAGCGADSARPLDPGETLVALLAAADARDEIRVRELVTVSSQGGLDVGALTARAHPLAGARIVLSELVDAPWAVAAVVKGERAFAVPLRRERGSWRVELGDPIRLRPINPDPGARALRPDPQIAAEAKAGMPVAGIALWVDGVDFSVQAGGLGPRRWTAFGRVHPLAPGLHVVVAFARAGAGAAATAWTFSAPAAA